MNSKIFAFLAIAFLPFTIITAGYNPPRSEVVVFDAEMTCHRCVAKIERTIPFEKGVKDVNVSLENKTVEVKYDPAKTNVETLEKNFDKISVPVRVRQE